MSFHIFIEFDDLEHPEEHFFFRPVMDVLLKSGIVRSEDPLDVVSLAELQAMDPIDMKTDDGDLMAIGLVAVLMVEPYERFLREWSMRANEKMNVRKEQIDAGRGALKTAESIGDLKVSSEGAFAMGSYIAASFAWRRLHLPGTGGGKSTCPSRSGPR